MALQTLVSRENDPQRAGGRHRRQLPRRHQEQHHSRRCQARADGAQLYARDAQAAARRHPPHRAGRGDRGGHARGPDADRRDRAAVGRRDFQHLAACRTVCRSCSRAHFGADRVTETKPIMAGEDFSRFWLADKSKQSMIFWVGGVPKAKWDAVKGDTQQTARAAQPVVGARRRSSDLDRDRSDDGRRAGYSEERLGRSVSALASSSSASWSGVSFSSIAAVSSLQLLDAGRAGDRRDDRRAAPWSTRAQWPQAARRSRGDLVRALEHAHPLAFEIVGDALTAGAFAEVILASVLAGQEAVGEAVIREDAEAMASAASAQRPPRASSRSTRLYQVCSAHRRGDAVVARLRRPPRRSAAGVNLRQADRADLPALRAARRTLRGLSRAGRPGSSWCW